MNYRYRSTQSSFRPAIEDTTNFFLVSCTCILCVALSGRPRLFFFHLPRQRPVPFSRFIYLAHSLFFLRVLKRRVLALLISKRFLAFVSFFLFFLSLRLKLYLNVARQEATPSTGAPRCSLRAGNLRCVIKRSLRSCPARIGRAARSFRRDVKSNKSRGATTTFGLRHRHGFLGGDYLRGELYLA